MNLSIMGIYPEMIEYAIEVMNYCIETYGFEWKTINNCLVDRLKETSFVNVEIDDVSHKLVSALFEVLTDLIHEVDPDIEVENYVNGTLDTHFYIDGETI